MDRLRQTAPLLCALLALVVAGETADLFPCADDACRPWSEWLYPDAPPVSSDAGDAPSACLCHVTFASTAVLPSTPASVVTDGARGAAIPRPTLAPAAGVPSPPPRG
jgi:hypothetical protein